MQGKARKIVQAILYEAIAVACVAPALELAFGSRHGAVDRAVGADVRHRDELEHGLQLGIRTLGSAPAQT